MTIEAQPRAAIVTHRAAMASGFQLCYITDRKSLTDVALADFLRQAIEAGVDLIQIREKDLETRELVALVGPAVAAARGTATRVVVNDRLDVALALGAAGVHLGGQSLPPQAARRVAPRHFLVGVSCHSLEDALGAEVSGADYVLLGPVYETPSKLGYGPPLGLARLDEVARRVKIPVLALGGLTIERVRPCLQAGATGIAGISVFQTATSLPERVRELRAQFAP